MQYALTPVTCVMCSYRDSLSTDDRNGYLEISDHRGWSFKLYVGWHCPAHNPRQEKTNAFGITERGAHLILDM